MSLQIKITFKGKESKTFLPGDLIQGYVIVTSITNMKIKGLKVHFEGLGKVQFSEKEGELLSLKGISSNHLTNGYKSIDINQRSTILSNQTREYYREEKYLESCILILPKCEHESDFNLKEGRWEFPFEFKLPIGLPPSFQGTCGSVTYSIRIQCVLNSFENKYEGPNDFEKRERFYVGAMLDLRSGALLEESSVWRSKSVGFCQCWNKGNVEMTIRLSRNGFISGDYLPIIAEFTNNTRYYFQASMVLKQETLYHGIGKTRKEKQIVKEINGQLITPGESDLWEGQFFLIPSVSPTNIGRCKIIEVTYKLKAKMTMDSTPKNAKLKVYLPIVIGSM